MFLIMSAFNGIHNFTFWYDILSFPAISKSHNKVSNCKCITLYIHSCYHPLFQFSYHSIDEIMLEGRICQNDKIDFFDLLLQ